METKVWASRSSMQILIVLFSIFATSLLGWFYPDTMGWIALIVFVAMLFVGYQERKKGFRPKGKTYKVIQKIKKKREKIEKDKHKHIGDQLKYIEKSWGYTKEQDNIINKFISTKSYQETYNKLTASILPQIIKLIDNCNERGQKGCKRDVSQRLKALVVVMKDEIKKSSTQKSQNFDIGLEVCDQLLGEKRV